ncbi:MAG TPA: DUF362 domain-containing protein [Rhizomicrobium sp.]
MKKQISRRGFLEKSAVVAGTVAASEFQGLGSAFAAPANTSPVYFTKDITVAGLLKAYAKVNQGMTGKIAVKLHTGEPHGPNLLPIELIKGLQAHVTGSTIVECNVLYPSPRQVTETHRETLKTNGFDFCPVDIMDAEGDASLPVPGMQALLDKYADPAITKRPFTPGQHLTEVAVGKHLLNYDSLLVYTHFKGHTMAGFGGSLKNVAIGCASGKVGKLQIHGEGFRRGDLFLERMVEAGKAICTHFGPHITYINVLKNLSVDCDCDAHGAKPTAKDIGILASTDVLAIDKASLDMMYALPAGERHDIIERIESRDGPHQIEYMKTLGMGNERYELIAI